MRLLLVTEQTSFIQEMQKVGAGVHELVVATHPDSLNKDGKSLDADCAVCDERFFQQLKSRFTNPIFILSQTASSPAWIEALQHGADGVLFENVPAKGIVSQLSSFLRRLGQGNMTKRVLPKFNLLIDLERYRVEVANQVLDLTLTELKVLKELAQTEDRVIPRQLIQTQVFGQLSPGNRSLDVHVCSLRKKLRPHGVDVESVRGVGYRLLTYSRGVKAPLEKSS